MAKYEPNDPKIRKLIAKLKKWDDHYHNTDKPLVSDERYDKVRTFVLKYAPNDPYFKRVGAPVKKGKVKLPYFMPSLDKVYPDRGTAEWLEHSSGVIDVLDKLDGTSALIDNPAGTKIMYTRGNGAVGQNISRLLPSVKHGTMKKGEAVRGELMIKQSDFTKDMAEEYENTRNLGSGIANNIKGVHKFANKLNFVVHESVHPHLPWYKARVKLKSAGFETTFTKRFQNPTVQDLEDHLSKRRKQSPYLIDGLVLIDAKTGARISFKVNAPSQKAVVDHVEWNLSKNGLYKPVAIFKKAIRLAGTNVTRATVHNAKHVVEWGIGPGAVVAVIKAGEVIPKVVGVIKKTKPSLPKNFEWDLRKVEAVATKLSKKDTKQISIKRLTAAFSILGIDSIRTNVASKLIEAGYGLSDLFTLDEDELQDVGVGVADSKKLVAGLKKVSKTVTHPKLMWASHVWPSGFTDTRFEKILLEIPYKKLIKMSESTLIRKISSIHGFSPSTAQKFATYLDDYIDFVEELPFKPKEAKRVSGGKLDGMSFVFTKVRSKEAEEAIRANGGTVSGSISAKTTAVIVKALSSVSTKLTKAKSLGIEILTLNEFKKKYKL